MLWCKLIRNMPKERLTCALKSLENPAKTIILPNKKTIYLGRNEDTCITDTAVSRKQIAATADYENHSVLVETNGINFSGCNGYALRKSGVYHLKHEDCLELLIGRHMFQVAFTQLSDCESETEREEPVVKKKKVDHVPKPQSGTFQKCALWESIDNGDLLIYTSEGVRAQSKIAAFDLDGTLIKTKSGARFPKDFKDWALNFPAIRKSIKQLFSEDYKLVIFSNQAGIGHDQVKVANFKSKIENIVSHIDVPIQVFIATTKSVYRKPLTGMWDALSKQKNNSIVTDVVNSFYVGDAAGRPKNWTPKKNKDHSISDRLFALNLNLKFFTPEEYFLKSSCSTFEMPKFDPRDLTATGPQMFKAKDLEVIMMVGYPASGKSFFCKKYLISQGYVHINRDTLGTWQKCVKLLEQSLKNKLNVVVDNTNPDKATRKKYIEVAKEHRYPVRCFLMKTTLEHAKHNNKFRSLTEKSHVGDMVLHSYQKQFQEPTIDEGFTEIVRLNFVPDFDDTEHEKLYKSFLLE